MGRRIMICEDESAIRDFVIINLQRAGYETVGVSSGEEALEVFEREGGRFDAALLDVMLPGLDGFEVLRRLRQHSTRLGIIMLTAKTQEVDKVSALMLGADDYVTKPFSPSELIARIDALCRRIGAKGDDKQQERLESGPFVIDRKSHTLYKNDQIIELTQVEFQIMGLFLSRPNVALKRAEILKEVWGAPGVGDEKIVDVNIRRIRMKIEVQPSAPRYIQTIWGYGYKWIADAPAEPSR